jgi:hypothetical protein
VEPRKEEEEEEEELHNLYSPPQKKVTNLRNMGWAGYVACMRTMINA